MKIVVLDSYTVNPGDLDWSPVTGLGECTFFDRTPPEKTSERIREADIVLTNKTKLNKAAIASAPRLRYIGVMATGYDTVDLEAARASEIVVTNVPTYSTASTSQATIALLLELTNHIGSHDRSVHQGQWSKAPDFCYWERPILELSGMSLGVVGWGRIGRSVATVAASLGMSILVASRSQHHDLSDPELRFLPLADLISQADVITLHCALTEETRGLINVNTLNAMKKSALLLNTARGGLIVEEDLAAALNSGMIAGAALDVLGIEPPDGSSPLLTARNCVITPHNAWASATSRKRLIHQVAVNIQAYLSNLPINIVGSSRPLP